MAACATPAAAGMRVRHDRSRRAARGARRARADRLAAARARARTSPPSAASSSASAQRLGVDRRRRSATRPRQPGLDDSATPTSSSTATCASPAGAACACATRSRARSRSRWSGAAPTPSSRRARGGLGASRTAWPAAAASTLPHRRAVGAGPARPAADRARRRTTTCGYCGVGCTLDVHTRDGGVAAISPDRDGPGQPRPRLRQGPLRARLRPLARPADHAPRAARRRAASEASWDEALGVMSPTELRRIRDEHGPDAIAAISSARATNEENYLMQKLMRVGDRHQQRRQLLPPLPRAVGRRADRGVRALGRHEPVRRHRPRRTASCSPAPTRPRPTPSSARGSSSAVLRGARLVVVDPRRIELARYADVHLAGRPGSNVAVFNGLAHVLLDEGLRRRGVPRRARRRASTSCASCWPTTRPSGSRRSRGVPADDLRRAARLYGERRARRRSSTASASPSTRTAPTACARWPTSRS